MRLGSQQSAIAKARKRRSIGTYSYGLIQLEYLEDRILLAGTPTQLAFTVQPSQVASGSAIYPAMQVSVLDGQGALVTTDTSRVVLSIVSGPLGGSISGNTSISAIGGVANFTNVSFTTVGTYTVVANDGSLVGIASNPFTVTAATTQLVFSTPPIDTTAGAPFTVVVSVEDANGNLVTTDHSSVIISINTGPSGSTVNGTTTVSTVNGQGQATFNGLSLTKPGSYKLQARDGTLTLAVSNTFNVSAGSPAKLAFAQQPLNTPGSATVTPAIVVDVLDALGNIVTGDNSAVTLSIATGPNSSAIAGTTTVNAVSGVATFSDISFAQLGVYTLQAADGALAVGVSNSFAITGAPAKLAFQRQPAQSTVGTIITPSILIAIEDAGGNTVPNDTSLVTLTLASGPGGTMSGTTTVAAVNGVATFSDISINQMGSYTITAADGSLTSAISNNFIVNGQATQLAFGVQPTAGASGTAIIPAVTVLVEDSAGNLVINATNSVSIGLASGPVGAAISGNTTINAVNGVATFANLIPSPAGTFSLSASSGTLTGATSASFVVAPAATQLVFAPGPSNVASGSTMFPAVVVKIENDADQVVTTNTTKVTLAIVNGPANATMGGTTTVAAIAGVATFSNLTFSTQGIYTLLAYDGTLATATSDNFSVNGPPAKLQWSGQPAVTVIAGQVMPRMSVWVEDRNGNIVTSDHSVLTLSVSSGPTGGTIVSGATVNATDGLASFTNVKFNIAGTYVLAVADGALRGAKSKSFQIVPDVSQEQLTITRSPVTTLVARTFSTSVVAKVTDQFGNVINNNSAITLSIDNTTNGKTTGIGTLSGTKTIVASHGVALFSNLSLTSTGTYTLMAADASLRNSTASSFEVVISPVLTTMSKPGVAASYTIGRTFSLSTQLRGLVSSSAQWTGSATVVDSNNNVLATDAVVGTGGAISFTVTGGLTAGVYATHVRYSGDVNHTGANSPTFNLVVGPATTISLVPSATRITAGASTLTLTATVKTGNAAVVARTGTLTLMDGTLTLGTLGLSPTSSGVFTLPGSTPTLTAPGTGSHLYTVVYSGDAAFRPSTSPVVTVTVLA